MGNALSQDNSPKESPCIPKRDKSDDGNEAKASQEHDFSLSRVDITTATLIPLKSAPLPEALTSKDNETRGRVMPKKAGSLSAGNGDESPDEEVDNFHDKINKFDTSIAGATVQPAGANGHMIHHGDRVSNGKVIEHQTKDDKLIRDHIKEDRFKAELAEVGYYMHDQVDENHILGPDVFKQPDTIASITTQERVAAEDDTSTAVITSHETIDVDDKPSTSHVVNLGLSERNDNSPTGVAPYKESVDDKDEDSVVATYIAQNSTENEETISLTTVQEHLEGEFQDSEVSTSGREIGEKKESKLHARLKAKEAKLQRFRWRNLKRRAEAAEMRRELHESRLRISMTDEEFMQQVRDLRLQTSTGTKDPLENYFQKLQAARNDYGPLEESYTAFEEQLDRDEYEVTQLEEQLSNPKPPPLQLLMNDLDSSSSRASDSDDLDSPRTDVIKDLHPTLLDEYRSRQGDANLARDEHSNLVNEYRELLERQEVRHRVGTELQPEDQAILAAFPSKEAELVREIRQIDTDVERLRLLCIEKGLLPPLGADTAGNDDTDILRDSGTPIMSEYERFSILLQKPDNKDDEDIAHALITDFDPGDIGDRITKWLLHKLKSSCIEVELLARISRPDSPAIDESGPDPPVETTEKWQQDVLEFWFFDETKLPPTAYTVEATANSVEFLANPVTWSLWPPPFADKDNPYLIKSSSAHLVQMIIRTSNLAGKPEFGLWLHLVPPKRKSALSI